VSEKTEVSVQGMALEPLVSVRLKFELIIVYTI